MIWSRTFTGGRWHPQLSEALDDSLRTAVFVDVGQGDCTILVDRESNEALLVDCRAASVRRVLRYLRDESVRVLDVLITHWDADHYSGAVRIAQNFRARSLYFNIDTVRSEDPGRESRRERALLTLLELPEAETALQAATEGVTGTIGSVQWSVLAPTQRELLQCFIARDRNHGSAVVHIQGAGSNALVGGDADGRVWERLRHEAKLPAATVLRCSHHGGSIEGVQGAISSRDLYEVVRPKVVIISAGTTNRYGHPAEATVREARAAGARVMCTQATPRCSAPAGTERPCAGDVTLHLDSGRVAPDEVTHGASMMALRPLCRD
jgi:competence protein ComEC